MSAGRTRFYIDASVEEPFVEGLRKRGFRPITARDQGLAARGDASQLATAKRLKAILITRDAGFLDEKRFPLEKLKGTGVVVIRTSDNREGGADFERTIDSLVRAVGQLGTKKVLGCRVAIKGSDLDVVSAGEIDEDVLDHWNKIGKVDDV